MAIIRKCYDGEPGKVKSVEITQTNKNFIGKEQWCNGYIGCKREYDCMYSSHSTQTPKDQRFIPELK